MPRTTALIFLLLLCGCTKTTEDKIKDAILANESNRLKANNEKIENIKIDSLRYRSISEQTILKDKFSITGSYKIHVAQLKGELRAYKTSPFHNKTLNAEMAKTEQELKELEKREIAEEQQVAKADTTKSIYKVYYLLNVKTDKNSYKKEKIIYLNSQNLNEYNVPTYLKE